MHVGSMAFSDTIIYHTLRDLLEQNGPNAVISQAMICEASGVSIATTKRALRRLMLTGTIEGEFSVGIGYRYRIKRPAGRTQ